MRETRSPLQQWFVSSSRRIDAGGRFISAVNSILLSEERNNDNTRVAFDCEGVNLSRIGSVEVVSICFSPTDVFLVDLGGAEPCPEIVKAVKDLFESDKVTKIIHDCRMDCDALFHLHGIKVNNIHDTSCFHYVITSMEDKNLNDVLRFNGISTNAARDNSVYRVNPAFWATRPLTPQMVDWASADVDKLFDLASKQLDRISGTSKPRAIAKSAEFACAARDMKIRTGLSVNSPGLFIGRGGANLRSLQKRTGTIIYQERPKNSWFVFYSSEASLASGMRKMAN